MSLWSGDAVFSNLDLRLDVLERELQLPFSFVSGHIHELQIRVPWTRLNTEPITITINTIGMRSLEEKGVLLPVKRISNCALSDSSQNAC